MPLLKPLRGDFGGGHRSLVDYKICRDNEGKLTLRFSIAIANVGSGDLNIVLGEPQQIGGKTRAPAKQIIPQDDGGQREVDVGFYDRHEEQHGDHGHIHWHYNGLATLELVTKDGKKVNESNKEGYCLADSFPYPNYPVTRKAQFHPSGCERRGEPKVGLTIGWCDYYKFGTDLQYIPIEDVPPGEYQIRFTVNKAPPGSSSSPHMIYEVEDPELIDVNITEEDKRTTVRCSDV